MISVQEAIDNIIADVPELGVEYCALSDACGRILGQDIDAPFDNPRYDLSAMDGYAIRRQDLEDNQVDGSASKVFDVIGDAPAGHPFDGRIGKGQTVRIFTGGIVPEGGNAILIQENVQPLEDKSQRKISTNHPSLNKDQYIRKAGQDYRKDTRLFNHGHRLTVRDIALTASLNMPTIQVIKSPRISLLSTGDELVELGQDIKEGEIPNSNIHMLATLCKLAGAIPQIIGIAKDDMNDLTNKLTKAKDCDILLTTGGASVGDHDLVQEAMQKIGITIDFWKVAMRPGKPLMCGYWQDSNKAMCRALGLPGNPVSAMVTFMIFVLPLIKKMQRQKDLALPMEKLPCTTKLKANDQRQEYLRCRIIQEGQNRTRVMPLNNQDSAMLNTLAQADGLIIRPPFAQELKADQSVDVIRFSEVFKFL